MIFSLHRWLLASAFLLTNLSAEDDRAPFAEAIQPYIEEHCVRCHGAEKQKGDFRIDELSTDFRDEHDTEMWFEVVTRIGASEMPPEDEPQPDPAVSDHVVSWISDRIKEGEAARKAKRAPVEHYRLSREEYSNTVYDLLGVHYDTRAPGAFSEDPEWHGFERIGSELTLAPSHIEKYLQAAEEVIDLAFPDEEPRQLDVHRDALDIDWSNRDKREYLDKIGVTEHIRTLIWPGHQLSYLRPHGSHDHAAGTYRVRIKLSGVTPDKNRPPHLTLYSKALDRMIYEADVLAPEHEPKVIEFETSIPAGKFDVTISNGVSGPHNKNSDGRPGGFVFTTFDDPKSRAPWQRKMTDDEGNPLFPMLIFDWIEWEGPIVKPEDTSKREGIFPGEPSGMKEALRRFTERAWRRPVDDAELRVYTGIVEQGLERGLSFREAYKSGLLGVMASKNFTYLVEGEVGKKRDRLDPFELASRLSYFLWSSMPDDELIAVAKEGTLSTPEELRAQFVRMTADPKFDRFLESFPRQWLQLGRLGMFPPDEKLYPDYDSWLEQSMALETTEYFAEMFRNNLPLDEFLDSNWSMLNPRLAQHYGVPAPDTSDFQRVVFRPEENRGGILTHGSILSLTSDGTRHRPVHRGIWVSEAIFGKVPPPPPANVDAIEPNPVDEPKATVRMKLAAHIENPNCASCHAKIDPLGFAFDNYDAIGRWRTEEIVENGLGDNPTVDASGKLPDGRTFETPSEFKKLVAADTDDFARSLAEKLANYGLRRVMSVDDDSHLDAIAEQSAKDGYKLRSLVEAFVLSDLFQSR